MSRTKTNDYTITNMASMIGVGGWLVSKFIKIFELKPIELRYGHMEIYSKESFEKLKWYFDNRKTVPQLAEEYNTSPYEIRRFLKDNNLHDKRFVCSGFVLTDEQKENLIKWLNKPLTEKLIDAKIKNYGSLENYEKEMIEKMQKTTEEKYKPIYGDNWKTEIYYNRAMETIIEIFGSKETFLEYNGQKSKERWENMTDDKKTIKTRENVGNERKTLRK